MYPEYDDKGYEEDIHKYTFPHRKVYDAELDRQKESEAEELDTDDMKFNSMAVMKISLYGERIIKTSFFKSMLNNLKDLLIFQALIDVCFKYVI